MSGNGTPSRRTVLLRAFKSSLWSVLATKRQKTIASNKIIKMYLEQPFRKVVVCRRTFISRCYVLVFLYLFFHLLRLYCPLSISRRRRESNFYGKKETFFFLLSIILFLSFALSADLPFDNFSFLLFLPYFFFGAVDAVGATSVVAVEAHFFMRVERLGRERSEVEPTENKQNTHTKTNVLVHTF